MFFGMGIALYSIMRHMYKDNEVSITRSTAVKHLIKRADGKPFIVVESVFVNDINGGKWHDAKAYKNTIWVTSSEVVAQ